MKESDILYQNGKFWVCKGPKSGFEVYRDETGYAHRVAIIGYKGDEGLQRAVIECDRRAEECAS